jgi:hypothetical protein
MTTKPEKPTGLALLRMPFPAHQISKLPKPYKADSPKGKCAECGGYHGLPAVHLDYVGHAALTDRLLDCDPSWDWQPLAFTQEGLPAMDKIGGMWIKLTICGVTRMGYGHPDGKTGGNAVKEVIGDALRNAAMRFGAALDLWHKGDLHGDGEDDPIAEPEKPRDNTPPFDAVVEYDNITRMLIGAGSLAELGAIWKREQPIILRIGRADPELEEGLVKEKDRVKAELTKDDTP